MKLPKPFLLALPTGFLLALTVGSVFPVLGQTAEDFLEPTTPNSDPAELLTIEDDAPNPESARDEATVGEVLDSELEADSETLLTQDSEDMPDEDSEESSSESENVPAEDSEDATADGPEQPEESATDVDPEAEAAAQLRRERLIEADRLYEAGDIAAAQALYRTAKLGEAAAEADLPPEPFSDEAQLSPAAAVYWREANAGIANDRESQALVSLALLTEEYPAFTPGHLRYAEVLQRYDQPEAAEQVLEQALTQYPAAPELLAAQVELMMAQEQWLEASIAGRQFAALNPEHPTAEQQTAQAAENLERFKRRTRSRLQTNAIANVFTGVVGYALTGSILGPFTAAESAIILLQGESTIGRRVSEQAQSQLPMLENEEVLAYVRELGQELAAVAGREEFDYEFYVILDRNLNAFALPGGKVFLNAGAILDTRSEAELAGLIAHELSHAVLSHGFQLVTQGNLTSSVAQYLPLSGLATNFFLADYSRQMERQADVVGTQILAASGYAADGLYHLMVTLNEKEENRGGISWFRTHPSPQNRVDYLLALVERGGYNRYAYEGVARHEAIQALVEAELAAHEAEEAGEKSPLDELLDAESESSQPEAEADEQLEP